VKTVSTTITKIWKSKRRRRRKEV